MSLVAYEVTGANACKYTIGCLLQQGGGVAHRTIDCTTAKDLEKTIERLEEKVQLQAGHITELKAMIYDLEHTDEDR